MTMSETAFEAVPAVETDERPHVGTLVLKFGGTSVADPEKIRRVASRLVTAKGAGGRIVAVVSAMGQHTDELVALAHEVSPRPRHMVHPLNRRAFGSAGSVFFWGSVY